MTEIEFLDCALSHDMNVELLKRLRDCLLPDCYLTAGCLFQTVWNKASGRPPGWGIKDYDVFYFDEDLSWEGEDRIIRQIAASTSDLRATIEVRNQARVHLWYPDRFGGDYPRLTSSQDGMDRYLVSCTCVGIEVQTRKVYAPNGFDELAKGLLRMNPHNPKPDLFIGKAESYRSRWPWLSIECPERDHSI